MDNTSISKIQLQILNINNPDNWSSLYSLYPNSIIISAIEGIIGTGGPRGIYSYGELITFASKQLWASLQIYAPDSGNDASIYIRSNINKIWNMVSISNTISQK